LPRLNRKEVEEIPDYVKKDMTLELVDQVDDVLKLVLVDQRSSSGQRSRPSRMASPKLTPSARSRRPVAT